MIWVLAGLANQPWPLHHRLTALLLSHVSLLSGASFAFTIAPQQRCKKRYCPVQIQWQFFWRCDVDSSSDALITTQIGHWDSDFQLTQSINNCPSCAKNQMQQLNRRTIFPDISKIRRDNNYTEWNEREKVVSLRSLCLLIYIGEAEQVKGAIKRRFHFKWPVSAPVRRIILCDFGHKFLACCAVQNLIGIWRRAWWLK